MFVIRLPNGNLQVPQTAVRSGDGRLLGDVYVEQWPLDELYAVLRDLKAGAISDDEAMER